MAAPAPVPENIAHHSILHGKPPPVLTAAPTNAVAV
jgi:hypothetical protein